MDVSPHADGALSSEDGSGLHTPTSAYTKLPPINSRPFHYCLRTSTFDFSSIKPHFCTLIRINHTLSPTAITWKTPTTQPIIQSRAPYFTPTITSPVSLLSLLLRSASPSLLSSPQTLSPCIPNTITQHSCLRSSLITLTNQPNIPCHRLPLPLLLCRRLQTL